MKKLFVASAVFKTIGVVVIAIGIFCILGVVGTSDVETLVLRQEIHSDTWAIASIVLGLFMTVLGCGMFKAGKWCKATAIECQRRHRYKMIKIKAQARESVMRIAKLYE